MVSPRSGKSAVGGAAMVRESLKYKHATYGIIAVTLRQAASVVMTEVAKYCSEIGLPCRRISEKIYQVGYNQFHLFSANNQRAAISLQGYSLAGFYIDEVVNVPETVMLEITNRLSQVPMAKVIMTANTGNPNSWFYKDYLKRAERDRTEILYPQHVRQSEPIREIQGIGGVYIGRLLVSTADPKPVGASKR